jgi:hypothetical protein
VHASWWTMCGSVAASKAPNHQNHPANIERIEEIFLQRARKQKRRPLETLTLYSMAHYHVVVALG